MPSGGSLTPCSRGISTRMSVLQLPTPPEPLPPRRILAVFNPVAGGDRRASFNRVVTALRGHGCAVTVVETTGPGHAEVIARNASANEFDVVAAAGGDGTINEVVNGLGDSGPNLGLIPLGTANVLASEIGLSHASDKVAHALAFGRAREIRVGRANGRRFVMMAGVGFDANVVAGVSLPLKRRIGPLAYVWQSVKEAAVSRFDRCDVTINGGEYRPVSVVICNGRRYGGPFIAARNASLYEARFKILLMHGGGWFSVLRYGIGLLLGRVTMWRDVQVITAQDVTVRGLTGQAIQIDGDATTTLPVHITMDPLPVRLIHPVR